MNLLIHVIINGEVDWGISSRSLWKSECDFLLFPINWNETKLNDCPYTVSPGHTAWPFPPGLEADLLLLPLWSLRVIQDSSGCKRVLPNSIWLQQQRGGWQDTGTSLGCYRDQRGLKQQEWGKQKAGSGNLRSSKQLKLWPSVYKPLTSLGSDNHWAPPHPAGAATPVLGHVPHPTHAQIPHIRHPPSTPLHAKTSAHTPDPLFTRFVFMGK